MPPLGPDAREAVKAEAARVGFDVAGVADARVPWDAGERLRAFVELGRHGDMGWMATTLERRAHPAALWPDARSAVMVGLNYGPVRDPLAVLDRRGE
ncbi:MAG: tRNA epoxyqueuosine(34) reductase QueG, partial [Caulobacterales bacterium]|nr:tRNA epoxyqueuosine(34) reductase QueG [Caulobacterales bacterium]